MDYLSIEELVNATSGDLTSKSEEVTSINELVIDSRIANKNSVFFAIIGESLDGHKFINSAIENGCKTIIKNKSNILFILFIKRLMYLIHSFKIYTYDIRIH